MSKKSSASERIWQGSLMILGSVIALTIAIQLLSGIWGWLLLAAAVLLAGLAVTRLIKGRAQSW